MVYVRHEHCAVAAAMAYARKTGDVGVATVTCGPGVTQLITALPAAVRAHLPLVVFAGEAPLKSGWYNQEIDQAPLITATGAAYHRLHMPERMPVAVRDAFLQARRERRPVVIGVPFDLQDRPWDGPADLPKPSRELLPRPSPIPPHPDDVAGAAKLLAGAERVVVLAGLGAVEAGAGAACRALAAKTGGLLSTTLPARGLFHDDPFCIGISGSFTPEVGLEYLKEADFVVAVGCSLAYHAGGGGQLWPKAKMLQIDIDPVAVSQGQEVARHHLRADARLGVEALTAALPARKQELAHRCDGRAHPRFEARQPRVRDRARAARPARRGRGAGEGPAARLGDGELERPLLVVLRADALAPAGEVPHHPRVRRHRQRHLVRHGRGRRAPGPHRRAVRRRRQPADARAGARDHPAPRAEHPDRRDERRRLRLRSAQAALRGHARGRLGVRLLRFRRHRARLRPAGQDVQEPGRPAEARGGVRRSSGGAAVWDFHVSDKVVSPTIRRAHPARK